MQCNKKELLKLELKIKIFMIVLKIMKCCFSLSIEKISQFHFYQFIKKLISYIIIVNLIFLYIT